jgi:DNA polymerase I-like protein with 3'-5' exonuclease and polymerase domains
MKFVGFDLETRGASEIFSTPPGEFVRVGGWMTDNGPVTTADIEGELIPALNAAEYIHAHNFFGFDGLALAYHYPDKVNWEDLAAKALDTMVLERLRYPPEARDVGGSKDRYDLTESCRRNGVPGKTDNLKDLAAKHGGYENIPLDDEEFLSYLRGDLIAGQALFDQVFDKIPSKRYAKREFEVESWLGRMTLNGFRVDLKLLAKRIKETERRKKKAMQILAKDYGLPLGRIGWKGRKPNKEEFWEEFSSPLSTQEGREWLAEAWAAFGIVNPPLTETKRLSTKAEDLKQIIEDEPIHPDLENMLELMMIVTTSRTVYQTVDDYLVGDRVYPHINMGQASGRSSVTKPGLTVFGKKGDKFHERDIFIGEPGWVVFTADLNQVDMRGVAGLCGDKNYAALFENGRDPHGEIALQFFGSLAFRDKIKPITHGANYGLGKNKLIKQGHDEQIVKNYFRERETQFPGLMAWQMEIRAFAKHNLINNGWGRLMKCDPDRVYTQAPALMGQGCAADILKQCILRLPASVRPYVRVTVHDEIVFCCPKDIVRDVMRVVKAAMTWEWHSPSGLIIPIECDLSGPADSWGATIGK